MGVTVYLPRAGRGAGDMEVSGPGVLLHYGALRQVALGNANFLLESKASGRFTDNGQHENF